jgi:hypothetical protein
MLPTTLLAALLAVSPAVSAAPLPRFVTSLELRLRHLLERQDAPVISSAALSQSLEQITTATNGTVDTSSDDVSF